MSPIICYNPKRGTARKRTLKSLAKGPEQGATHAQQFQSLIDRAAKRGGIHHRKAARLKSRLAAALARAGKTDKK